MQGREVNAGLKHEEPIEETQERASLYALGALSQHEARAFERHLSEGCPACKTELAQFEITVGLLSLSASPVAAPQRVKDVLRQRIKAEPRSNQREPASLPKAGPKRNYIPWAVAACLALVSAAAFYTWQNSRSEVNDLQARLAEDGQTIRQLESRVRLQVERSEQLQTIVQILKQPGARVFRLTAEKKEPAFIAEIIPDSSQHRWLVDIALPPVPTGKTYQLWFVTPDAKISAGILRTDTSGHGFALVDVPSDIGKIAAAAITVEPEGGSAQPTLPIVASVAFDSGTN
jgi:anti-sigma-K factor RskA